MSTIEQKIIAIASESATNTGEAKIKHWDRKEAVQQGFKWCAMSWGLAVLTLPIPGIHFITVPACLLLGPLLGVVMYKVHKDAVDISDIRGLCPSCSTALDFKKCPERWPQSIVCSQCSSKLSLLPVDIAERKT